MTSRRAISARVCQPAQPPRPATTPWPAAKSSVVTLSNAWSSNQLRRNASNAARPTRFSIVRSSHAPFVYGTSLKKLVLSVYHDEDVVVYLNGQPIFEAKGFVSNYAQIPLDDKARLALKLDAENVLAISCTQTTGGQYIDVGLSVKNRNR